jgi:dihydrofolate reductase
MGKVILGTTLSLDGFIADRNGDVSRLYPDLANLRYTKLLQESIRTTGAAVMGRVAYEMGQGDFTGYEYQVPIFVLTHHPPKKVAKGENDKLSIHFVTDGIESAIRKAKAAAGDKDVQIIGGASTFQQILKAGLFDELIIGLVPVLLGEGLRAFAPNSILPFELERTRVVKSPTRTDIFYRVKK